jgi:hypothetical protein
MPDIESEADDVKRKRQRSPAYPFINLETALRRAKEFYEKEVRNAVNIKIAAKHWGYEEKSSGGLQTAATLISFGLLRDEGTQAAAYAKRSADNSGLEAGLQGAGCCDQGSSACT